VTVPDGHFITATATDPQGNTSEFSACVPAQAIDFSQVPARNYFTSTDVRLTWKGVNWASSYQIQIATDKDFKHILEPGIEVGAGSPYYAWTAPGDGTYYWHVRAKNAQGGVSLWSAVDSFVVDVP
jgi:hypothetical protein